MASIYLGVTLFSFYWGGVLQRLQDLGQQIHISAVKLNVFHGGFCCFVFESASYYVVHAGPGFMIFLPQPPEVSPHPMRSGTILLIVS